MVKKVSWLEGMALLPHHFQQAEKYYEALIQAKLSSLQANLFDFIVLSIDTYSLCNGVFALSNCKGIMPSGLFFESSEAQALVESRAIGELFPVDKDLLDVYLAAPLFEDSKANLSNRQGSANALYTQETAQVADQNTGTNLKTVTYSRQNLKILFEGEQITGYEVIKVAELKRNMQGQIDLNSEFMPLFLSTGASEAFMRTFKKIIDKATEKLTWLISQNLTLTSENLSSNLLLATLNQHMPVLNSLYANHHSNPEQVFNALLGLAGALCTTNPAMKSTELPYYNHMSQQASFESLATALMKLLETSVELKYELFKMTQQPTGEYTANLIQADPSAYAKVFISVDSPLDRETLVQQVKQIGRAAPSSKLKSLVISALPGINIDYVFEPPLVISPKPEKTYFSISTEHPLWAEVVSSRTFSVHVPQTLSVTAIEFIGLK